MKNKPEQYHFNSIFISSRSKYERIMKAEILFIEAQGAYVDIYLANEKIMSLSTHLKNFVLQLNDHNFIQVSRKHVVNLHQIHELRAGDIKVGNRKISVSKPYRVGLMSLLPIIRTK